MSITISDHLDAMRVRRSRFPLVLDFGAAGPVVHRGPLTPGDLDAIRRRPLRAWGPPLELWWVALHARGSLR